MKLRDNFPINGNLGQATIAELCEILLERLRDKADNQEDQEFWRAENGDLRVALCTYLERIR